MIGWNVRIAIILMVFTLLFAAGALSYLLIIDHINESKKEKTDRCEVIYDQGFVHNGDTWNWPTSISNGTHINYYVNGELDKVVKINED